MKTGVCDDESCQTVLQWSAVDLDELCLGGEVPLMLQLMMMMMVMMVVMRWRDISECDEVKTQR